MQARLADQHKHYLEGFLVDQGASLAGVLLEDLNRERERSQRAYQEALSEFKREFETWLDKIATPPDIKGTLLNILAEIKPEEAMKQLYYRVAQWLINNTEGWDSDAQCLEDLNDFNNITINFDVNQGPLRKQIRNLSETFEKLTNNPSDAFLIKLKEVFSEEAMQKENALSEFEELILQNKMAGSPKLELLLVTAPHLSKDLARVIQMRATVSRQKGNGFVVMPYAAYETLMEKVPPPELKGITKLSFLHHRGQANPDRTIDYSKKVGDYVKRMPDVKDVVLRGCAIADKISRERNEEKEPAPELYTLKIFKGTEEDFETTQQQSRMILFMQKNGNIYLRYVDENQNLVTATVEKMRAFKNENNLTFEEAKTIAEACPTVTLKIYQRRRREKIESTFFDRTKPMSNEEIAEAKRLLPRAQTKKTENAARNVELLGNPENFLGEAVRNSLMDAGCNVRLKVYLGPYEAALYDDAPPRVIPGKGHGFDNQPKARQVMISSAEEVKEPVPEAPKIPAHQHRMGKG